MSKALRTRLNKIEARDDARPPIWHDVTPAGPGDDPAAVLAAWQRFLETGDCGNAWIGSELVIPHGVTIDEACQAAARIPGGNHRLTIADPNFFSHGAAAHELPSPRKDSSDAET